MKRKLLLLLWLCLVLPKVYAQNLYEIQFTDDSQTKYKGFMVYFNEKECYMRIGYKTEDKKYNIVNVDYEATSSKEGDANYVVMLGKNPRFITSNPDKATYNPDTFIWVWKDNEANELPYTTDDPEFKEESLRKVDSYREVTLAEINEKYLRQFFKPSDPEYQNLLAMVTENQKPDEKPDEQTNTNNNGGEPKIHLIMVANTLIGDIGESCNTDKRTLINEFDGIAETLGIGIEKHIIDGKDLSKQNIIKTIAGINPSKNDVVIFAYSGHGFRWNDQKDQYPQMALTYNNYQSLSNETSMALSDAYNQIVAKGARLNLVFGDCCNSLIGVNQFSNSNSLSSRSNVAIKKQKLKKLFIQSQGNIILAGASPGEYSYCNNTGGFFLNSFLQALHEEISYLKNEEADWSGLVQNTLKYTKSKAANKQNPLKSLKVTYK